MWSCWKLDIFHILPPNIVKESERKPYLQWTAPIILSRAKQQFQCRVLLCELGGCYSQSYVLPPKHGGSKRSSKWPRNRRLQIQHHPRISSSFTGDSFTVILDRSWHLKCLQSVVPCWAFSDLNQQQCGLQPQLIYTFFAPHVCII